MRTIDKWLAGLLLVLMGFASGCAATRTGTMAGTDSQSPAVSTNEKPLGADYGAVNKYTAKQSPKTLDAIDAGQTSTGNGTPPSTGSSTGDPVNQ